MKRSNWIDNFLNKEIKKIAFEVEANYVDRVKRLMEDTGRGQSKWSSIEEALDDFASRNGFSRKEVRHLQKAASSQITDKNVLKKMEEEGLGSSAIEYMSRAKGKHTPSSASPFFLTEKDYALSKKMKKEEESRHDLSSTDLKEYSNEFSPVQAVLKEVIRTSGLNRDLVKVIKASQDKEIFADILPQVKEYLVENPLDFNSQLRATREIADSMYFDLSNFFTETIEACLSIRTAQDKILDIPGSPGDPEAFEQLEKELKTLDISTPYKIVRHGFKFTSKDDKSFKSKGEPVKVTVYRYSFLKRKLAEVINEQLRDQLSRELPIDQWIEYLEGQSSPRSQAVKHKLEQIKRDLYSEDAAFVETKKDSTPPGNIKRITQLFPASYQKEILKMLVEGQYRHLTSEEGREFAKVYTSGYRVGSFVLMDSYDPFLTLKIDWPSDSEEGKEKKREFIAKLTGLAKEVETEEQGDQSAKLLPTYEKIVNILSELGISYSSIPTNKEQTIIPFSAKRGFKIQNALNPDYNPTTNKLTEEEAQDPELVEEQLQKFQDQLGAVLLNDIKKIEDGKKSGIEQELTPLIYAPSADGSFTPINLLNMGKQDYTAEKLEGNISNPYAGLHPIYKGEVPHSPLSKKRTPKVTKTPTTPPTLDLGLPEKEDTSPGSKFRKLLKNQSHQVRLLIRLGQADVWISDRGNIYSNESMMEKEMTNQILSEYEEEIIDLATNELEAFVSQLPDPDVSIEDIEEEDDKDDFLTDESEVIPFTQPTQPQNDFALAAGTIVKLEKLSSTSESIKKLLNKYKR